VDIDYTTLDGRRSVRRIEPYSLRRTREDHAVLDDAKMTDQVFAPNEPSPERLATVPGTRGDPGLSR